MLGLVPGSVPQMKLRRALRSVYVGTEPAMVAPYDPQRLMCFVAGGQNTNYGYLWYGDTPEATLINDWTYLAYYAPMPFYGPGELWARLGGASGQVPGMVLVQDVYAL